MAMKRIVLVLVALGVCGACSEKRENATSLAVIELVYSDRIELVYLPNNYGFLIDWIDHEKPEFYLYNKPSHRIQMTRDFQDFLVGLQAFPNGATVDRIRCCAITEQGMPEDYKTRLRETIENKRFHLSDGDFTVCSCQTIKVRRYRSADQRTNLEGLKVADYNRR